jgi:hypothetical protein
MKDSPKSSDADKHKEDSRQVAAELEAKSALKELDQMKKSIKTLKEKNLAIKEKKEDIVDKHAQAIAESLKSLTFTEASSSHSQKPSAAAAPQVVEKSKKSFFKHK